MLGKLSRRTRKKLEERGKLAPAVVVEIAESGMSISSGQLVSGTELVLKTKLRIEPPDEPAFEVEDRFRYPQLAIPSAGSRLAVIYDPQDHDKVMIDHSAALGTNGAPGAGFSPTAPAEEDPVDKLAKLQELREKGALTDAEFEAQKARILGEG